MITNYGTLKEEIRKYLYNRKDLETNIPSFISLAERKIFRMLRIPAMENVLLYEPLPGGVAYAQLELPGDFLEAKFLLWGDKPLRRISDIEMQRKLNVRPTQGTTHEFARIGNRLLLWPTPDDASQTFSLGYWRDYSNTLKDDADVNDMLRLAPDLYLYGACLEASVYLVGDSRIPVWQQLYDQSFAQLTDQYKEAEYAGSNVSVSAAGSGGYGDNSAYYHRYYR
ncbi:MAG: hypothetical protein QNI96_05295 [Woeseiaceae bacterium]|nr:hypothetical protein [Woeseiaceae bacterium]